MYTANSYILINIKSDKVFTTPRPNGVGIEFILLKSLIFPNRSPALFKSLFLWHTPSQIHSLFFPFFFFISIMAVPDMTGAPHQESWS
jgi:hypothetical protein